MRFTTIMGEPIELQQQYKSRDGKKIVINSLNASDGRMRGYLGEISFIWWMNGHVNDSDITHPGDIIGIWKDEVLKSGAQAAAEESLQKIYRERYPRKTLESAADYLLRLYMITCEALAKAPLVNDWVLHRGGNMPDWILNQRVDLRIIGMNDVIGVWPAGFIWNYHSTITKGCITHWRIHIPTEPTV